jgi:hypothetical protein
VDDAMVMTSYETTSDLRIRVINNNNNNNNNPCAAAIHYPHKQWTLVLLLLQYIL